MNNAIPFDLERWKTGDYEVVYDGNKVHQLTEFKEAIGHVRFAGLVNGVIVRFAQYELLMRLPLEERYVNVYRRDIHAFHKDTESADLFKNASNEFAGRIKITFSKDGSKIISTEIVNP
jgi:hypothetical protein